MTHRQRFDAKCVEFEQAREAARNVARSDFASGIEGEVAFLIEVAARNKHVREIVAEMRAIVREFADAGHPNESW